jgi:hypothetical protein
MGKKRGEKDGPKQDENNAWKVTLASRLNHITRPILHSTAYTLMTPVVGTI